MTDQLYILKYKKDKLTIEYLGYKNNIRIQKV